MNHDTLLDWTLRLFKMIICFCIFHFSGYFQYIPVLLFHIKKITAQIQIELFLFSNVTAAILIFLLYRKDIIKEAKIFIKNWKEDMDIGLKYWVLGLFIMMISNIIINFFSSQHIAGNEKTVQTMIETLPWFMFLNAGFIAPFVEELTFRKTFRTILEKKWVFALFSGLLFGLGHVIGNVNNIVDVFYIIPYGALGVTFALAYYETGTIFTSISFHMIHNIALIVLSII